MPKSGLRSERTSTLNRLSAPSRSTKCQRCLDLFPFPFPFTGHVSVCVCAHAYVHDGVHDGVHAYVHDGVRATVLLMPEGHGEAGRVPCD